MGHLVIMCPHCVHTVNTCSMWEWPSGYCWDCRSASLAAWGLYFRSHQVQSFWAGYMILSQCVCLSVQGYEELWLCTGSSLCECACWGPGKVRDWVEVPGIGVWDAWVSAMPCDTHMSTPTHTHTHARLWVNTLNAKVLKDKAEQKLAKVEKMF